MHGLAYMIRESEFNCPVCLKKCKHMQSVSGYWINQSWCIYHWDCFNEGQHEY